MGTRYRATRQLSVGDVLPMLAHNVGDDVPEANIERNGWADGVEAYEVGDEPLTPEAPEGAQASVSDATGAESATETAPAAKGAEPVADGQDGARDPAEASRAATLAPELGKNAPERSRR